MSTPRWLSALRRFLGGRAAPPTPHQRPSRSPELPPLYEPPRQASVRYVKERPVRRTTGAAGLDPRRRRLIWAGAGLAVIVLPVVAWLAYNLIWPRTIPEELQGTWRTSEPRYAGRRFELLDNQVVFQVGDSAFAVERYAVQRVIRSRTSRGQLYRVRYGIEEGGVVQFSFLFDRDNRLIRFANQTDFSWARTGPPSARPRLDALP